ncbi:MAG: hypothetical protein LDL56_07300 [Armatimonadetes bacterium]|nr:hypothetical protein [Armatimonadota bacterium]
MGLQFRVNGRRGWVWTMTVAYEPDDTYTVWLTAGRRVDGILQLNELSCERDVYCDELQGTVEAVYDAAIQTHNGGFIKL